MGSNHLFFRHYLLKKKVKLEPFSTLVCDDLFCVHHPTENSWNKHGTFSLSGMHKKVEKTSFCVKHGSESLPGSRLILHVVTPDLSATGHW